MCETFPLSSGGIKCIAEGPPLPEFDVAELSHDQAYLYRIIKAVKTEVVSNDLLREKPGPLSHARWLTTASRICRLYVAADQPSENLQLLARFVVQYYGPTWFQIKLCPWCTDGSNYFLEMVELLQHLTESIKSLVWPVVQRNSYWGHHENVLLEMLADLSSKNRQNSY